MKEYLYKHLPTISNEEYQKYVAEADLGYITINKHPEDDNIVILNYTELTTFEKRWNEQTLNARGLILDLTNATNNDIKVLAKPFKKFFNYGENPELEKNIDFTKIAYVAEKMDGSLGISYFFKDGLRFATRGSFVSEQAIEATKIWNEKYANIFKNITSYHHMPFTMLVEIIYPENRIVVDYGKRRDLTLLSVIDLWQGELYKEFKIEMVDALSRDLDMPMAKIYHNISVDELLKRSKEIGFNEEGWVVTFENGEKLKIKGSQYLEVHRLLYGISTKKKYQAWAEGRMNDYIKMLPEEFRKELEEFEERLDAIKDKEVVRLQNLFNYIKATNNDRKLFAYKVKSLVPEEDHKYMFSAYKTEVISEEMVKLNISRNYRDYEMGVGGDL